MIALAVAFLVDMLIAVAIELVWRKRREARHARSWAFAFTLTAAGWGVVAWTTAMNLGGEPSGAAPSLCWLAACLLFVHGLRQRAGGSGRGATLGAIWIGVAGGMALLLDVARLQGMLVLAMVPALLAAGLLLAAVAVGPRGGRWRALDIAAAGLLIAFGGGNLVLGWCRLFHPDLARTLIALAPLAATPVAVGLGLAAMLLLNDDLTTALHRLARIDPLTGVWNRRGFEEGAAARINALAAELRPIASVAIADIDSFKAINDRYGHGTGDAALVRFAKLLRMAAEPGDLLARLGGEEFALLAMGADGAQLLERMERARARIALPDEDLALPTTMTASFGVAQIDTRSLSLREALERADRALYRAKQSGKNRTELAEPGRD